MYENFVYYTPTKVIFGKDTEQEVGRLTKQMQSKRVMIHYGGGSAIRSGLIDRVKQSFSDEGIDYIELGGVVANPHLEKVYEGIALGQREQVDFILAVGGGSVIDSAKAIAVGLANPGQDVWDYFIGEATTKQALPVGTILTLAATGSEMSSATVITNEKSGLKRGYGGNFMRPVFAILNPELTMTLPSYQTFSGVTDIMMHTMERFFNPYDNMEIVDRISVAILKNVMKYARVLLKNPKDYQARAEMMWAGSLSHNGLTESGTRGGDWATHNLEHEIGGMFDVTHGAGLAAIWGTWARYVYHAIPHRFESFALDVMDVEKGKDQATTIERGIQALEDFFHEIGMPTNLKELGIQPTDEQITTMAASCADMGGGTTGVVVKLTQADMETIYHQAMTNKKS